MSKINPTIKAQHADFLHKYAANVTKEELLDAFISHLRAEHALNDGEINALLAQSNHHHETLLPINIFKTDSLSALEAIVKYLKENKQLSFHDIAVLLKRDDRTIWATYAKSRSKMLNHFHLMPSKHVIPASLFAERKLSVLETIVHYLKHAIKLNLHEIAVLLNRDDRTIWTVWNRASKKEVPS